MDHVCNHNIDNIRLEGHLGEAVTKEPEAAMDDGGRLEHYHSNHDGRGSPLADQGRFPPHVNSDLVRLRRVAAPANLPRI